MKKLKVHLSLDGKVPVCGTRHVVTKTDRSLRGWKFTVDTSLVTCQRCMNHVVDKLSETVEKTNEAFKELGEALEKRDIESLATAGDVVE